MQTPCMSAPIVAAPRRRVSRSARWLLVVIGVLFGVALINWVAISVHISNLRHEAAVSTNEDEVLGLRADAQEFQSAQSLLRRDDSGLVLRAVRRTDQHDQLDLVERGLDVVTGVGDRCVALELTGGVDPAGCRDLCHVVGKMGSVEESHSVPVERDVEGGRETTVARADDGDIHRDTVAPPARGSYRTGATDPSSCCPWRRSARC